MAQESERRQATVLFADISGFTAMSEKLDPEELTHAINRCFATLAEPASKEAVRDLYERRYADEPFVHVLDGPPNLRAVRDTNECHVYVTVEERGRVMAFSAIDNIWKGASSQGVQNLNLMLGLDETEGLV